MRLDRDRTAARPFARRAASAAAALLGAILTLLPLAGCVKPRQSPNLPRIFTRAKDRVGKAPIIVIPGILGSQIVNRETGEIVWPSADLSKHDDLDLPISPDLSANRDGLIARGILDTTRLSVVLPEIKVYSDLLATLQETAGYKRASIDDPPADGARDTFYVFYYDWRRDNVENAHVLSEKIDALKQKLGRPDLKFNILAHSMGGLIARYYAMYGDREIDPSVAPDWSGGANISRLVLLGVPNHGSMDALRSLVEGYNYYGGDVKRRSFFNKLDSELILSLPAVYQLLPHAGLETFVNESLALEPIDLYDTKTWATYRWGVFGANHQRRLVRRLGQAAAAARERDEEAFLASALARARAFHESLERAPERPRPFGLFLFGGDCEPTLRAPFIAKSSGTPLTVFRGKDIVVGHREIERKELAELMFAPGDGRVTRASLLAEEDRRGSNRLFPSSLGIDYAVFTCELHGDLPNNSTLQDNILSILVTDVVIPASEPGSAEANADDASSSDDRAADESRPR